MSRRLKRVSIVSAVAAIAFASAAVAFAQSEHEGHHPPEGSGASGQAAPPPAAPAGKGVPMEAGKGMGCMMGGDQNPMMKLMQDMHGKMMGGSMTMAPKGDTGPSSLAFNGVIAKMHQDMAIPFSGNADVDFVKSMIPHHQSAVDMAKVVLAFGKDPGVKKVAEDVIKAQEAEIAWLKDWLKKQGQ